MTWRRTRCMLCACLGLWLPAGSAWADAGAQASDAAASANGTGSAASLEVAPDWSARLGAGVGVGYRSFELPVVDGTIQRTELGVFPAWGLGFALEHAPSRTLSVGLDARYQSSLGLVLVEPLTDGSRHRRETRSQRLEVALASKLRLDARGHWALNISVGYAFSDFRPVGHLVTPAVFLGGPYARLELQLPLASERVRLRLGPEAHWITHVGRDLERRGLSGGGFGLGGTAALEVTLTEHWSVAATYHEVRTWLSASGPGSFADAARFALASIAGAL